MVKLLEMSLSKDISFYPNVTTLRSGLCYRRSVSVCRLAVCRLRKCLWCGAVYIELHQHSAVARTERQGLPPRACCKKCNAKSKLFVDHQNIYWLLRVFNFQGSPVTMFSPSFKILIFLLFTPFFSFLLAITFAAHQSKLTFCCKNVEISLCFCFLSLTSLYKQEQHCNYKRVALDRRIYLFTAKVAV